jgi:hypothetical protein
MPPQVSILVPKSHSLLSIIGLLGLVVIAGAAGAWGHAIYVQSQTEVTKNTEVLAEAQGTQVTSEKRVVAWNAPDMRFAGAEETEKTYHPLELLGRGTVLAASDARLSGRMQEIAQSSFITIFLMKEIDQAFLERAIAAGNGIMKGERPPLTLKDISGATIIVACAVDLEDKASLVGMDVEVPDERCSSGFEVQATLSSGEKLYVGSGFYN